MALVVKNKPKFSFDKLRRRAEGSVGRAEGLCRRAEGLVGRAEGLREAIGAVCELLSIELTAARRARLSALDVEGLEALLSSLKAERRWPR